jgi:phosphoribosylaminoimidazole carboxylase PurK protein
MSMNAASSSSICKSPAWLGILGGGQLGRMFIHEAQSLGFKVCVLDPDPLSPGGSVAEKHLCADYLDTAALSEMASLCSAISTEFENVPAQALDFFKARGIFVAPDSSCVSIAQDRIKEKAFLAQCAPISGVSPVLYGVINCETDLALLADDLFPGILKTVRLGYDGKGQVTVQSRDQLAAAWADLGRVACVLEKRMALAFEVSAIVARGHDGDIRSFPPAENIHRQGILHTSTVPSPSLQQHPALLERIQKATSAIAQEMKYVGVLCVEYFVLTDGSIVANEVAPRPIIQGTTPWMPALRVSFSSRSGQWPAYRSAIPAYSALLPCSIFWVMYGLLRTASSKRLQASQHGSSFLATPMQNCICTARHPLCPVAKWAMSIASANPWMKHGKIAVPLPVI